jgi:hypothetical protein
MERKNTKSCPELFKNTKNCPKFNDDIYSTFRLH